MAKIKITQTISRIGSTERQKKNLDALGLKKMNRTVVHEDSPIIKGMVEKVKHLVKVETIAEEPKAKKAAPKKAAVKAEKAPVEVESIVTENIPATVVEVEEVVLEPVKED
jgi:large subunit ribosomal protein L30